MDSNDAATTFLLRGKEKEPVEFPKKQAKRILDLQQRTGLTDYVEAEDEAQTDPPTPNADNGQPGDSVDTNAGKRKGSKAGE
ncbi:hypothetical protein [Spirosoma areae]